MTPTQVNTYHAPLLRAVNAFEYKRMDVEEVVHIAMMCTAGTILAQTLFDAKAMLDMNRATAVIGVINDVNNPTQVEVHTFRKASDALLRMLETCTEQQAVQAFQQARDLLRKQL